ncbi:uncharacterized protein LOC114307845 isoform X1 [Camellia sinensis]|uniref:uncharacterized protein LOC114307845 isoform X1 n=2 Tax=Camellia sinensis TaxID=4442 RepID=UPI0010357ED7|nr:uncharacterized protein LOC114307845 isoform X1 [Camellia sinensis]
MIFNFTSLYLLFHCTPFSSISLSPKTLISTRRLSRSFSLLHQQDQRTMEANLCDINHLNSDVLLPPRKRLLAGLKKQNFDGNSHQPSTSTTSSEFDTRLNNLLRSHLNNPNLSPEEIVEASRSAAAAAVKVAEAARAAAEEKAAMAAKAVAAAKSALELVAAVSEESSASRERYSKKNKMKKHIPVQTLYNKHKPIQNCRTDEELARKLHQAINSSPRISKHSSTSELKGNKHKRLKGLSTPEKSRVSNGGIAQERNTPSMSNGNGVTRKVNSEGSSHEAYAVRVDENVSKLNKLDRLKMDNGEAETSRLKEKNLESSDEACSIGRKRGRMKQKKLPLSICTFRDRSNPKEELKSKSSPLTAENTRKTTSNSITLVPVEPSVGTTSMWKCKAFKAPVCVKQNKVVQS